jgi:hypothetical protein
MSTDRQWHQADAAIKREWHQADAAIKRAVATFYESN